MEYKLDLHVHSQYSPDGRMSVEELVCAGKAAGLSGLALCDHDRVYDGPTEFDGFFIIPGVEYSTEHGHLLGLFIDKPLETGDFFQTAEAIRAAGGLAVLAHPFERCTDPSRPEPLAAALDGVEVWNGRAQRKNPRANAMARDFGEKFGLRFFAGSDAHVPAELGNGVTTVSAPSSAPEDLKAALMSGKVNISGGRGKSIYVAQSQLTKLKKKKAPLTAYGKWALFAAKCAAEDLFEKGGGFKCR